MDKQRILKEAQTLAAKFSFWMVSGNIAHLYGYAYETPDKKYELEIKFEEDFPKTPPNLLFHEDIKDLLGDFTLNSLNNWTSNSKVIECIDELKMKIEQVLNASLKTEKQPSAPVSVGTDHINEYKEDLIQQSEEIQESKQSEEDYITPDLNAYPPDFEYEQFVTPSELLKSNTYNNISNEMYEKEDYSSNVDVSPEVELKLQEELIEDQDQTSLSIKTELSLIQQEYAYDQRTENKADLTIYLTITVSKTFMIHINFQNYPERPMISFPEEVTRFLGEPNQSLETIKKWNTKTPSHIVDIIRELENKLFLIKEIEVESKKILGEYQCDINPDDLSLLSIHLVTYGFKEYLMDINLRNYPKPPIVELSSDLQQLISIPISEIIAYKGWKEEISESVEIVREIAWLVDKNSRINFEIELLKEHYKTIEYDPTSNILKIDMKGKMKTQDLTFQFQIDLPREYPMKLPTIKVLNEFELDTHEKIKADLQSSFKDFFNEWTPYSYLVDLFNLISKKIFEISVVSCVICHKIECPTCGLKIAGPEKETDHIECPYCERPYHKHCWDQTIRSFGKCGFCLKTPPPNLMPT